MAALKRIFISFDYDHDRRYRYLLSALSENSGSQIEFEDLTPEEIQSDNVDRIKAALSGRITRSTHTLVVIGKHANTQHSQHAKIGTRNWQWWEIEKTKEKELSRFIAVKIERGNESPQPLFGAGATWANAFRVDSILQAINSA